MRVESPIAYVSLFLSILGIGLFVLSGYQHSAHHDRHQFGHHEDVFVFDPHTNITRLSRAGGHVCIGFNKKECQKTVSGASLRVAGGIQLGGPSGPVVSTSADGRLLDVRNPDGTRVRIRLGTGGVLVGAGTAHDIPETGTSVKGAAVSPDSTDYDTERWEALSGFVVAAPDGTPYAQVHDVVHDSGLRGTRLSLAGPGVDAAKSVHITPSGLIVGDATWEFIDHASKTAQVIVTGEVYYEDEDDTLSRDAGCLRAPIGKLDLPAELIEVEVESCAQPGLLAARLIKKGEGELSGCSESHAFFDVPGQAREEVELGKCASRGDRTYIYYCKRY